MRKKNTKNTSGKNIFKLINKPILGFISCKTNNYADLRAAAARLFRQKHSLEKIYACGPVRVEIFERTKETMK